MMKIVPLAPEILPQVEALNDGCFGPARHLRTASLMRHGIPMLDKASFAALDADGVVIGAVQCHIVEWRRVDGLTRKLVLLGPLVSHPDRRGTGIGAALMEKALAACDALSLSVMLIGDLPYYSRWGFSAEATQGWILPGPVDRARLLLRTADQRAWNAIASFRDCPAKTGRVAA